MLSLITAEQVIGIGFRALYFSNWGVYLTTLVTLLQLINAIKYKRHLDTFNIRIKTMKKNYESTRLSIAEEQ